LLIGLGMSSISDSWYGFAQNEKVLENYYKLLENNELPVVKGHILNEEDLIIRQHILNIMCRFETNWTNNLYFEDLPQVLQSLKELQKDGLIHLFADKLIVTEKGKTFIRNICMAFDLRLMRNKPERQLFSMTV